jgi:hypothetical protein
MWSCLGPVQDGVNEDQRSGKRATKGMRWQKAEPPTVGFYPVNHPNIQKVLPIVKTGWQEGISIGNQVKMVSWLSVALANYRQSFQTDQS